MFVFPTPIIGRAGAAFGTLNPADKNANITLSNGNLTGTGTNSGQGVTSTTSVTAGKAYLEVLLVSGSDAGSGVAVINVSGTRDNPGVDNNGIIYQRNGGIIRGGVVVDSQSSLSNGNIVMVAVDIATSKIWFGINGAWVFGNPAAGSGGYTAPSGALRFDLLPGGGASTVNFGASAFSYTIPSGFVAWG